MQPRTVKGPSWANEAQLQPQTPMKESEGIIVEEGRMDNDPPPSQDALSDLEWMRQRMAKSIVKSSDTTARHSDPPPSTMVNVNQVRPLEVIHSTPHHLTQLEIDRSFIK